MAGTSGTLGCQSNQSGRPKATFTWPVAAAGHLSGSNLTFYNLSREDNGRTVTCRASNSYTENRRPVDDATFVLQVYYAPVVSFTRFPDGNDYIEGSSVSGYKQCIVAEGQRVHINCNADSNPPPLSFKWLDQGRDVYSNTSELMIISANHTLHNGDYNCTVVTKQENMDSRLPLTSSAILTVIVGYPPNVLNFKINNADKMTVNVREKSIVDMKCLSNGSPAPSITLINATGPKQLLNQSQSTSVSADENQREVGFRIEQVPCEASGVYRCDANNSLGQDSQSRTLLVYCAPRNADFDGNPPTVSTTSSRGEFSFKLTAYPTPVFQKLTYLGTNEKSDGHPAKENSISVECSGDCLAPAAITCTIRAMNITYQDEGFYRLILSNSMGEMSFIFSVKQAALEEDQLTAASTKTNDKTTIAVLAVVLAVVVVINIAFVVWMWRRGWILPCAEDGFNETRIQQNQMNGDTSDQPLSPAFSKECTLKEGQGAPLYDALQMQEVGRRSHYEEIRRYQNAPAMSYEVVSDTSGTEKEEYTYVN